MKVLTIKQPWASLIINKYKRYEFRSWKTNYRGKILIHAGVSLDKESAKRFYDYNLDLISGAIIGEAELIDCIPVDDSLEKELLKENPVVYKKSNYSREYAWKLDNIIKYDEPIYIKGQLGLWNYDK